VHIRSRATNRDFRPRNRGFEIRLRAAPFVFVLGVAAGCMALAFYFGFNAGQRFGFEMSSIQSLAETARLPIIESDQSDFSEELLNDMYARLNGSSPGSEGVAGALVELSKVNDLDLNPRVDKQNALPLAMGSDSKSDIGTDPEPAGNSMGELSEDNQELSQEVEVSKDEEVKSEIASLGSVRREENKDVLANAKASLGVDAPGKRENSISVPEATSQILPSGWYAQVGAPNSKSDAIMLLEKLDQFGFRATIEEASVQGQSYFRVLVGPESSKLLAGRLLAELKREPYIEAEPFIRTIK